MKKILIALSLVIVSSCTKTLSEENITESDTLIGNIDTTSIITPTISTNTVVIDTVK